MKRLIKMWDVLLIAILGLLGTGCKINEPPPAEYGPEPEYGAPYSVTLTGHVQQEIHDLFESDR